MIFFYLFSAVVFFGCSEARHKQDYGCDEDDQTLDVLDKFKKKVQVILFSFNASSNIIK